MKHQFKIYHQRESYLKAWGDKRYNTKQDAIDAIQLLSKKHPKIIFTLQPIYQGE